MGIKWEETFRMHDIEPFIHAWWTPDKNLLFYPKKKSLEPCARVGKNLSSSTWRETIVLGSPNLILAPPSPVPEISAPPGFWAFWRFYGIIRKFLLACSITILVWLSQIHWGSYSSICSSNKFILQNLVAFFLVLPFLVCRNLTIVYGGFRKEWS